MQIPEFGYARSASEFYHQANYPFVGPRKLGPVVEVDSPEAAEAVREAYPWDRPTFVQSAFGDVAPTVHPLVLSAVSGGLGLLLGIVGFQNRSKLLGALAMSTSGSLLAVSIMFLVREFATNNK